MFNDELSLDECNTLVSRLAGCRFPFQCAHGRYVRMIGSFFSSLARLKIGADIVGLR